MTTDAEALKAVVERVRVVGDYLGELGVNVAGPHFVGGPDLRVLCTAALRVAELEEQNQRLALHIISLNQGGVALSTERDAAQAELAAAREQYDRLAEVRSQERETRQPAPPLILHVDAAKAHRLRSRLIAVEAALREIRDGECNDRVYEIARAALEGGGE